MNINFFLHKGKTLVNLGFYEFDYELDKCSVINFNVTLIQKHSKPFEINAQLYDTQTL